LIALTAACALACAALVIAEWRGAPRLRIAAKLVASMAFVALGSCAYAADRHPDDVGRAQLAHAVVTGLALGAIGDACLLARGKRWFLAGLVAFLLGHLAYVAGIAMVEPAELWLRHAGWLAALPVGAGLGALVMLWPKLGALRLPVLGYVATITVMVVAAIACARGATLPAPNRWLVMAGAALFFVSDLAVARDRFIAHTFANKLWGLPAYYAAQLLFAWSLVG
jgi:uncharacterized membrane protein YhhN